jgi:hypothetical protein
MNYHAVLRTYVRDYALPGMFALGWIFKPAKDSVRPENRRQDYHIDQSLRTHILNGLYALTRVLEYLDSHGYCRLTEGDFKRILILYTLHDAYKDSDLGRTRIGTSEYSLPLEEIENLIENLHLRDFAPVKAEDVRAASVSLLSPYVGDLPSCTPGTNRLLVFVHLADALASQQNARDYHTAERRLHEITGASRVAARQRQRIEQRIDPSQLPQPVTPQPKVAFFYHELDDYRGLSTLMIHQATQDVLAPFGLYPILYFANGVLYIGPADFIGTSAWEPSDVADLRTKVATTFFQQIREQAGKESLTVAREALSYGKSLTYSKEVYLFSRLEHLIEAIRLYPLAKKPAGFVSKIVERRVATGKYTHPDDFSTRYSLPLAADQDEDWAARWNAVYMLLMGIEALAKAFVPVDSLEWLLSTFPIPAPVALAIKENSSLLHIGGVSDHCLVIAYHWLTTAHLLLDKRTALEVDLAHVQQAVAEVALQALKPYDTEERRLTFVNEELGLLHDFDQYLSTMLTFSFARNRLPEPDLLPAYEKARSRSHKRLCVICNRIISPSVKSCDILTAIAEQQAFVFSNRLLPAAEIVGQMVWCPLCYLEFLLRKLSGQSFPAGSDTGLSRRLYLYILPDYAFTPQLWDAVGEELLGQFYGQETVVTRLPLRGSREEPSLPTRWLDQHQVDQQWLDQVSDLFAAQAERMSLPTKEGKPRRAIGDRLTFSFKAPNYALITYSNAVPDQLPLSEKARIAPTVSELWAKALYAAALLHLLTGARIYLTERPYLSITRPEQMKSIIEMEGMHPSLSGVLPMPRQARENPVLDQPRGETGQAQIPLVTLPLLLDIMAAIWEVNTALTSGDSDERRNRDKRIADVLEQLNSNRLAGATLYKMRERKKAAPYPVFVRACQLLLPQLMRGFNHTGDPEHTVGYQFMIDQEGGDMMNLAKQVTDLSLQLFLPTTRSVGRAHRYESIFRTGIEAMKSNAKISDDELIARVGGALLKRLDRISGGICPTYGDARLALVKQLAELLVTQLYRQRSGGSVSTLTHEENPFADAVYYLTAIQIQQQWEAYKQQHPSVDVSAALEEGTDTDQVEHLIEPEDEA